MASYDLTPLFRSSVGFDHMVHMLDSALSADGSGSSYPPYNIEKIKEDVYRITMAVAGFRREDLNVILQDSVLIISGKADLKDNSVEYLHRGIAGRAFERHFQLADFIKVVGAAMDHGLLKINLEREVPESMKPRKINIEDEENKNRLIEQ
jgi:molecular chaperone IbpA